MKNTKKQRKVKAWAAVKTSNGMLTWRQQNNYSAFIFREKYEADYMKKTWKRQGFNDYKIVPVTITYNV